MNKNFDKNNGQFKLFSLPILSLILIALISCAANFLNIYKNSLPATWFLTYPDEQDKILYFSLYLYKTWTHLTAFSVGLLAGYLCRCHSLKPFLAQPIGRRCFDTSIWAISLTLITAITFSTHSWSLTGVSHLESPILSALYGSLAPLLWSISWSLILFYLTVPQAKNNQRSSLTQLLTSDVNFIRLGRLSFLAYLINPYVNSFIFAIQEHTIFSSVIMMAHTFIGNLVITFALAFIVSALVELPCRRLIKKLILGSRRHCTKLDIIGRQSNTTNCNGKRIQDELPSQQDPSTK